MYGVHDGLSTVYEGDCHVVNQWSLGLHLVINALSSLLLSASNYTMQVLNAPTRTDCDRAHAKGDWLDIGITSLRNITRITRPRRVLWILLGLSSVPIHLLYNSAAFKTIDANDYQVVVAMPPFIDPSTAPPPHTNRSSYSDYGSEYHWNLSEPTRDAYLEPGSNFENMTTGKCLDTYGVDFVTGYSDLIAMTSEPSDVNSSVWYSRSVHIYMDSDSQAYSW